MCVFFVSCDLVTDTITTEDVNNDEQEINGKARGLSWGPFRQYDTGEHTNIATDDGICVEVHDGISGEQNKKLYYRVGIVNKESQYVSWGSSKYFGEGQYPTIAVSNGKCVEIHTGPKGYAWYYRVGTINESTKSVTWGPTYRHLSFSNDVRVSLNKEGVCVVTYGDGATISNNDKYYKVGKIFDNIIVWSKEYKYDTGGQSAIALNDNGDCIEVHNASNSTKHYYRVGKVNYESASITWGPSRHYDTGGNVAVSIKGNKIFEVHNGGSSSSKYNLYYRTGTLSGNSVIWSGSKKYTTGSQNAIAMGDGYAVETHAGSRNGRLYYSVVRM